MIDELTLYNLEVKYHNLKDIANAIEEMVREDVIAEISKEMRLLYGNEYEKHIRAEVIDECIVTLDKIMPPQPYLIKSKHYETWKMKTTELRMLRDMLEQLKENK